MSLKKIIAGFIALFFVAVAGAALLLVSLSSQLPQMIKIEDYKPLLVSEVYARGGEKIGEFAREYRTVVPYDKIPKRLIQAFLAAEDDTFFQHGGINYLAIMRAFAVNLASGEKRQGASTITQQVARSLLLSSEKTYTRKIKEILLSYKMEEHLAKEEILYLYLNQIYFGEGAYGVAAAAETYFRKPIDKLSVAEMAILAGLPQAPSSYSPNDHPDKAKARQKYVLSRMAATGAITQEEAKKAMAEPVTVYVSKEYKAVAPFFVETLRQMLVQELGEKAVWDEGLRVYTSLDYKAQNEAQNQVRTGLRELDKRQGYRGALRSITNPDEIQQFLVKERKRLMNLKSPSRIITAEGKFQDDRPFQTIKGTPDYVNKGQIIEGVVTKVDDSLGLTYVKFAESQGLIDISDMGWARKPDPQVNFDHAQRITKPSQALKVGDVIEIKVTGEKFAPSARLSKELADAKKRGTKSELPDFGDYVQLLLEQQPIAQASLLSLDQSTGEVIALVGGYEFKKNENEFNRALQAKRQTGSSFKSIGFG
jgi:penicillin-binding protein 1A